MRFTAVSVAIALSLVSIGTSVNGQRADDQIDPRSLALLEQGKAAQAAGKFDAAVDALETALVVDPRNRQAFVVLAEVAGARDLPGKAIRLYREALVIEPNDVAALRGQGAALVSKGAVSKAKENLAKIRTICGGDCGDATQLAGVIAKGPPLTATAQKAPDVTAEATGEN